MAIGEDRLIYVRHDVADVHVFPSLKLSHVSLTSVSATGLKVSVES